jgi:hypothetical protein
VPDGTLSALAYSATELRYEYRYLTRQRDGRWTAWVAEFHAYGVLLREDSWLISKNNPGLLDHEQGHFDLAELWARRAQAEVRDSIRRRQLRETAVSEQRAVRQLQEAVAKKVEKFREAMLQAHRSYDQVTRYGTLADKQAEQRQAQKEAIGVGSADRREPERAP